MEGMVIMAVMAEQEATAIVHTLMEVQAEAEVTVLAEQLLWLYM